MPMPDESALQMLCTAQGEASMWADKLRREAYNLRQDARANEEEAERWEQRSVWLGEAIEALEASAASAPSGSTGTRQSEEG